MTGRLYRIGELAELSGVSAKTIRFYSDSGILPPTQVAASGYRLYSDADRGRLDLIRALRDTGIDLPTISGLLHDRISATGALALQLETVEASLRMARRQRVLLKAALNRGEASALAYLDRARAIAKLNALERQDFLSAQLERAFAGVPADEEWKAGFWQAAVLDLPEELTEAQFAAWLELAELVTDESFIRRLNEIGKEAWDSRRDPSASADWTRELNRLYLAAAEASKASESPHSPQGQRLIAEYVAGHARLASRQDDPTFPAELLATIERNTDPRAARYWELIAILKGWPAESPIAIGHAWLMDGLRWRVEQETRGDNAAPDT
jgi:DNA-binding transcriptional MerR regulator